MLRIKLMLVAIAIFSLNAWVQIDDQRSNCWDGSYAYRVASYNIEAGRVEVGFTANFGLFNEVKNLEDSSYLIIDDGLSVKTIYASFKTEQCSQEIEGGIVCEAEAPSNSFLKKTVFVGWEVLDLGQALSFQTPIHLDKVKVSISPKHLKMELFKYDYQEKEIIRQALIDFSSMHCNNDGKWENSFFGNAFFPERLRQFIGV